MDKQQTKIWTKKKFMCDLISSSKMANYYLFFFIFKCELLIHSVYGEKRWKNFCLNYSSSKQNLSKNHFWFSTTGALFWFLINIDCWFVVVWVWSVLQMTFVKSSMTYDSQHRYSPSRSALSAPCQVIPLCRLSRLCAFI